MKGKTFGRDRIVIKSGQLTLINTTIRQLRMIARLNGGSVQLFKDSSVVQLFKDSRVELLFKDSRVELLNMTYYLDPTSRTPDK